MALLNTHPDYLKDKVLLKIYYDFLISVKEKGEYWHALTRDVAQWWRERSESLEWESQKDSYLGTVILENDEIFLQ
jgi:hypothetical protein